MRRRRALRRGDALLLGAVAAIWLPCFALHLDASLRGSLAWIPVTIEGAAGPGRLPRVVGFWSPAVEAGTDLEAGDALRAVGGGDLAGHGNLATAARIYAAANGAAAVPVLVERDGGEREARLPLQPIAYRWRLALLSAACFAVGALAFWRAPRHPAARLLFLALTGYSLHLAYFWGGGVSRNLLAFAVFAAGLGLALPLALRAILSFPQDLARRDRISRAWPWAFAATGVGAASWAFGAPLRSGIGFPLTVGGSVAALALMAVLLAHRYRRTGPIGRRQIKWVVLGAAAAFAPPILCGVAALARPEWEPLYEISVTAVVLLPLALLVALVRDQLFDVDRLLTAAATFTVLGVLLLGGVIVLVPRIAEAADGLVDPAVSQPALAMVAALGLLAARARLEPWLERRLFPERERFERGAQTLRSELAESEKPAHLFRTLGERLEALLEPDSVVIYGRGEQVFAPLYGSGRAIVPSFDADGVLVLALEQARRLLDVETVTAGGLDDPLPLAERGALATMGTELVLPVLLQDRLEAFVCLGSKRSGAAYGATELALLQSVAEKAADELRRFALEEVHRDQRAMCERLRRYVPGALAARMEEGVEPPVGDREVSVLFVDIRGYVHLVERFAPRAVFSFVSRYAGLASGIFERHGGTIIDFQGDGLMAVFGAPDRHPAKERAALAAAREILAAIRALPVDEERPGATVDIGVGIATGAAFAGTLRTADQSIWSVVGNTVNLAARLQALTRELDAWVVIDAHTWTGAGGPEDFVPCPATSIRGRRDPVDLHLLPMEIRAADAAAVEDPR